MKVFLTASTPTAIKGKLLFYFWSEKKVYNIQNTTRVLLSLRKGIFYFLSEKKLKKYKILLSGIVIKTLITSFIL